MARHRVRRDYSQPNANKHHDDQNHRNILDMFLSDTPIKIIARVTGRKTTAIENLLVKIRSNYTEDGKRTSMIVKLRTAVSELDWLRTSFPPQCRSFFRDCHAYGRTLDEMVTIFFVPPEEIIRMEKLIIGGFGRNHRYENEFRKSEGKLK